MCSHPRSHISVLSPRDVLECSPIMPLDKDLASTQECGSVNTQLLQKMAESNQSESQTGIGGEAESNSSTVSCGIGTVVLVLLKTIFAYAFKWILDRVLKRHDNTSTSHKADSASVEVTHDAGSQTGDAIGGGSTECRG